jgi:hypothetical protein
MVLSRTAVEIERRSYAEPASYRVPWLPIVAVAVVVVLIAAAGLAFFTGAATAATATGRADTALKQAQLDQDTVDGLLGGKGPYADFGSMNDVQAVVAVRDAARKIADQATQVQGTVSKDRSRLVSAKKGLPSGLLVYPERASVDKRRGRLDNAIAGQDQANHALAILKANADFVGTFMDAMVDLADMSVALNASRYDTAGQDAQTVTSKLQAVQQKAAAEGVPAEAKQFAQLMADGVAALQPLIAAAKANDEAAFAAAMPRFQAASKAIDDFDSRVIGLRIGETLKAARDKYDELMAKAAR